VTAITFAALCRTADFKHSRAENQQIPQLRAGREASGERFGYFKRQM
jgi:hypothetical protein